LIKLLITVLGSTTVWTETPGLLNTIPIGNSHRFPMDHYLTPNSQRLMS
jgi:hypothetical protein